MGLGILYRRSLGKAHSDTERQIAENRFQRSTVQQYSVDVQEDIVKVVYSNEIKTVAVDFSHENVGPLLPPLYNLIFSKVRFIDSHRIYEDIFDRVPLSLVTYSWFLENISVSPNFTYDFLKRIMDIVLSFFLGIISLVVYPFVYIAIKLDDGGKIFI